MKRVRASVAVLTVTALSVAGLLAVPWMGHAALATENAARVRTCRVEMGSVEQTLSVTGRVRYASEYAVIAPADGVVAQVYVTAGESVTAGQALFRLDGTAQEAAVAAALSGQNDSDWTQLVPAWADASALERTAQHQADTQAEAAVAMLRGLTVRAPADGVVRQVEVSRYGGVMAGTPAMAMSGETQNILCSVVTCDAAKLRRGQRVRLIANGAIRQWGTVEDIGAAQVNAVTGQNVAEVRIIPDANLPLPMGTTLEAEIILCGRENVPVLPVEAVTERDTVWWVADGRCWEAPAEVVMADEINCWVNLPEGLCVICAGEETISGQRVKEMKP